MYIHININVYLYLVGIPISKKKIESPTIQRVSLTGLRFHPPKFFVQYFLDPPKKHHALRVPFGPKPPRVLCKCERNLKFNWVISGVDGGVETLMGPCSPSAIWMLHGMRPFVTGLVVDGKHSQENASFRYVYGCWSKFFLPETAILSQTKNYFSQTFAFSKKTFAGPPLP